MAVSSRHRSAVHSRRKKGASALDHSTRYQHHELIAVVAAAVLLLVIGALSGWAHYSLSIARPVLANTAATPPANTSSTPLTSSPKRLQLRAWLTQAEPSLNALLAARHEVAAAAASDDIATTGAACQTADSAVTSVQHHLPSPDPVLSTALQQAIDSYHIGLGYCIAGVQSRDGNNIEQAVIYINQGNAGLQAAVHILERNLPDSELREPGVMTV